MQYTIYYDDINDVWIANADGIIRWWSGEDQGPAAYLWLAQFLIEDAIYDV